MWLSISNDQCGYGTWVDGKRDGYFALIKEGGTYVEEYAGGELKRRIKWRKDRLHTKCKRCSTLFVPSANEREKLCRFHWNKPDVEGRYACCGALHSYNPQGCCMATHVDPSMEADDVDATLGKAVAALDVSDQQLW